MPHAAVWPVEELIARSVAEVHDSGRVAVSAEEGLPPVRVDDVQIQRVLVNVIENAIKFSLGAVDISSRSEGSSVVIEVADEGGAGAPGAGLGLAIARGFAPVNDSTVTSSAAIRVPLHA